MFLDSDWLNQFIYKNTHNSWPFSIVTKDSVMTQHTYIVVCVIVCFDADPGHYSQVCSLSVEPCFERGHYPTGVCTMVPFPPPSASEKQTHTLRDQSRTRNDCACAAVASSLNRHNWNPKVVAPEPVSVCWERLYWFELKMPFRAMAQQVSQRQTGRDISNGTVWDSQTAYVNKLVNTSVFSEDVGIVNPRQIVFF